MEQDRTLNTPGYRGLVAWQKSMDLVESVYRLSRTFPTDERFGLTSQMQRAAVSIPSNVAEGAGRGGGVEFARFLSIAYGSLCELETQLTIVQRLEYIDTTALDSMLAKTNEVARLLRGLRKSLTPHD